MQYKPQIRNLQPLADVLAYFDRLLANGEKLTPGIFLIAVRVSETQAGLHLIEAHDLDEAASIAVASQWTSRSFHVCVVEFWAYHSCSEPQCPNFGTAVVQWGHYTSFPPDNSVISFKG